MASFTVKATYNGQTRKFAFANSLSFPTYDQLHEQLFRVFPHGQAFYLSRLIFCPAPGKQILIGMEVHSKAEYDRYITAYSGGVFPGAILKVTVHDETTHRPVQFGRALPSHSGASTATPSSAQEVALLRPVSTASSAYNPSYISTPASSQPISMAAIPPPPILFPSPPRGPTPLSSTDAKRSSVSSRSLVPSSATASVSSCCEVSEKKEELQGLLTTFIRDFDRIASSTFGVSAAHTLSRKTSTETVTAPQLPPKPWNDTLLAQPQPAPVPIQGLEGSNASASTASHKGWIIHRGIMCDGCRNTVTGTRFKCMKCKDFDLCSRCRDDGNVLSKHATSHKFFRIERPSDPIHKGIICDACDLTIAGVRHKCLDCPDFDLCTTCIRNGAIEQIGHSPFHEFYDIKEPGKVIVHTVNSGPARSTSRPNEVTSASTNDTATVSGVATAAPAQETAVHHPAICNLCDNQIIGARYKCLACPDFDTCASCFSITPAQHPIHGFVKIKAKEDLRIDLSAQPQGRHGAWCDGCKKVIVGIRYKCMHPSCPDFDLCGDCEAHPIAVHPVSHPMLKMKTVDTVIPTVYRVGQTTLIPATQERQQVKDEEPVKPVPVPSRLPTPQPVPIVQTSAPASPMVPQVDVNLGGDLSSEFSHLLRPVSPEAVPKQPEPTLVDVSNTPATVCSRLSNEVLLAAPVGTQTPLSTGFASDLDAIRRLQESLKSGYTTPAPAPAVTRPEIATQVMPGGMPEMTSPTLPVSDLASDLQDAAPQMSQRRDIPAVTVPAPPMHVSPVCVVEAPSPAPVVTEPPVPLVAKFVSDLNIADGQVFPPGAEFVKSWVLENTGTRPWPESTELRFVAGDRMGTENKIDIGAVPAGSKATLSTPELKAPEVPGRYVAYWRLFGDEGIAFGTSVWIDITVTEVTNEDSSSDGSLAASSVIMPHAASGPSVMSPITVVSVAPSGSHASTALSEDALSDISLVDAVSINSDEELWQETRANQPSPPRDMEYVVLYDEAASSEDE